MGSTVQHQVKQKCQRSVDIRQGPLRVRCVCPLRRARALFTLPPLRGFPQDSSPWGPTPRSLRAPPAPCPSPLHPAAAARLPAGFESLGAHSAFAACAPFAVPEPSSPCRRCAASRRIRVPGGPLRVRCVRPLRRARALFTLPPLRGFPQDSSPWGPTPRSRFVASSANPSPCSTVLSCCHLKPIRLRLRR
jgi:hypothetical protein